MKKHVLGTIVGITFALLSMQGIASDIGMVGEEAPAQTSKVPSAGVVAEASSISTNEQENTETTEKARNFFVHVDGGVFFRNMQSDSGFFCLDTSTTSFGTACTTTQSWVHGQEGFVWSGGLGFRYNAAFALDFAYWGLQRQSTTAQSSSSNMALTSWLVSALYQAQVKLFSSIYLMPEVGIVYLVNHGRGLDNGAVLNTTTINWRPAVGLAILAELNSRFALNLSGLYVPGAGHSPALSLTYPSIKIVTLGLRYAF